jgi:hypothetical protein
MDITSPFQVLKQRMPHKREGYYYYTFKILKIIQNNLDAASE